MPLATLAYLMLLIDYKKWHQVSIPSCNHDLCDVTSPNRQSLFTPYLLVLG